MPQIAYHLGENGEADKIVVSETISLQNKTREQGLAEAVEICKKITAARQTRQL